MSIERDPLNRNSWIFELGEQQHDYESYLGIVESGRLGDMNSPAFTHEGYNAELRMGMLKTHRAYNWLLGRDADIEVSTDPLLIGLGKTARVTVLDEDMARDFADYMQEYPEY